MRNPPHGLAAMIAAAAFVLAFVPLAPAAEEGQAEQERPNILFIFSDDHAYQSIGAYGAEFGATPTLDRLAEEGMRFDNCFVTNSLCGPSRAVVLTGKYSHINGFANNRSRFDSSQPTFPKMMQADGYQTAVVGKWHLRSDPTGFDYWHILPGQGRYYNPPMIENGERVEHTGYVSDIITDITLDWLKNKRDPDQPFVMMYQHKAPHRRWEPGPDHLTMFDGVEIPEPQTLFDDYAGRGEAVRKQDMTIAETMTPRDLKLTPPNNLTPEQLSKWNNAYEPKNEEFREAMEAGELSEKEIVRWKYQRYIKDYLRCIASVDDNIARVLDYLDEAGLADNTLVIYASDQGFFLGEHGWFDKRWIFEESLRTPLIVRWPGVVEPGSVNERIVSNLDFAETILDAAGLEVPEDMQGRSLVPLLKGRTPDDWRDSFYYHYYEYPGAHDVRRHYGVVTDRYKLFRVYGEDVEDYWALFDLKEDPNEMTNVYGDPEYDDVTERLKAELKRLQEQYGDTDPEAPLT